MLLTLANDFSDFYRRYEAEIWLLTLFALTLYLCIHAYTQQSIQEVKQIKESDYQRSLLNKNYVRGYKRKDGKYVKGHYRNRNSRK